MNQNPYQPPGSYPASPYAAAGYPRAVPPSGNRTMFVLAAVGAWLASAYWAALTLLIGLSVALGSGSLTSIFLPCILIGLYAVRGFQIIKGDSQAATRIV